MTCGAIVCAPVSLFLHASEDTYDVKPPDFLTLCGPSLLQNHKGLGI